MAMICMSLIGAAGGFGTHIGDVLNGTDPGELATNGTHSTACWWCNWWIHAWYS